MRGTRKPIVVRPVSDCKSDINVTPLVDVVLVLLIIFMVVMPMLEKELAVRIPDREQVAAPDELPVEQIVVHVQRSGEFEINGAPIAAGAPYVDALRTRLQGRSPGQRVVFVDPDGDASYKRMVEAFEGARSAGARTLGMTSE
jgi:biopolymer transport protein ExbD